MGRITFTDRMLDACDWVWVRWRRIFQRPTVTKNHAQWVAHRNRMTLEMLRHEYRIDIDDY